MKLIIDIPDTAYEAYKEWHKQGVSSVEQSLIALAMPYEENPKGKPIGQIINAYTTGFNTGVETVKRPTGEWIDHSEDYGYVECPVCEHLTSCSDNKDELHYCWHCGAYMGGGAK